MDWHSTGVDKFDDGRISRETFAWDNFAIYASVKWDGCINLDYEEADFHICDLSLFIKQLQALEQKAKHIYEDHYNGR